MAVKIKVIKSKKVLITTVPFGEVNRAPLDMLESHNINHITIPPNKKLTEDVLLSLVSDFDVILATNFLMWQIFKK